MENKTTTKKTVKRVLIALFILLLAYGVYSVASIFLSPDRNIRQMYLVPKDAAFIIQTNEPVADWKKFSQSEPWQTLKKAESFAEIASRAQTLDSLLHENATLSSLVGKREMMISLHKTRPNDWDFLIIIDLQKVSKVKLLKDQIEQIVKMSGNTVTQRKYKDETIVEMQDAKTREVLYMSFVDNHFIASYSSRLVQASIDERENPEIALKDSFVEIDKFISGKGLSRIYINYAYVPQFLSIYLGPDNEYIDMFTKSMDFGGIYFDVASDKIEMNGVTILKEDADPFVAALLSSGNQEMTAHEIMSGRTAFYTNIGFDDPKTFVKELERSFSEKNQESYNSYKSSRDRIEKYFGISLENNFLDWMSGEFAITQSEPGLLGREPEMILAIRAKNIKEARESMDFIEKRIKGRTPINIKSVEYKGYDIKYVEMKGFFKLFFGSLLEKFEKPYYTFVGDYVIFSNKSASVLSFIEDYEQGNLMKNDPAFQKALSRANASSSIFVYADIKKFYPQLRGMMTKETWANIEANKTIFYSFPQWTFQVVGDKQLPSISLVMDYKAYEPTRIVVEDKDEIEVIDADSTKSESELMNELKRFYVEKFEGNVLREYYPEGALQSESEIKNGKRDGRYREYFESGKLMVRGKYDNDNPKGTWKYYTEDGKFDKRVKY